MSKIALTPSATGTGTFTISSPATNTNRTLTLPDEAGTVLTSASSITQNAGPAFSASANVTQSISGSTWTKVNFAYEVFDTNSNFSASRFTPTIAGYYQLNASVYYASSPSGVAICVFHTNGNAAMEVGRNVAAGSGSFSGGHLSYANGSTDYFEIYFYSVGANTLNDGTNTYLVGFSGSLVRAA